jgi:hypothetical protein
LDVESGRAESSPDAVTWTGRDVCGECAVKLDGKFFVRELSSRISVVIRGTKGSEGA